MQVFQFYFKSTLNETKTQPEPWVVSDSGKIGISHPMKNANLWYSKVFYVSMLKNIYIFGRTKCNSASLSAFSKFVTIDQFLTKISLQCKQKTRKEIDKYYTFYILKQWQRDHQQNETSPITRWKDVKIGTSV